MADMFIQCIWNRVSACREFCGVCSWQNGTRCRDGVIVLWCHSHLVWLVYEASIPIHALVFLQKTFCDLFLLLFFFFVLSFRNGIEKKGGRGRHMVNFFVHIKLRIIINSNASK